MQTPLQITFRNLPESEAVKDLILQEANALQKFYPRLTSCRVVVDTPHHSHHQGNHFRISIRLVLPGRELVVTRNPAAHFAHEDCYLAIRQAFHEIRRQLQDFVRLRGTPLKTTHHAP